MYVNTDQLHILLSQTALLLFFFTYFSISSNSMSFYVLHTSGVLHFGLCKKKKKI